MLSLAHHNELTTVAAVVVVNIDDDMVLVEHSYQVQMRDVMMDAYPGMVVLYSWCA